MLKIVIKILERILFCGFSCLSTSSSGVDQEQMEQTEMSKIQKKNNKTPL